MVDLVHQCTESQTVAQQHKLVLELRALFASLRQVLDSCRPFCVSRSDLTRESVQVIHEPREDLECARIRTELRMQGIDVVGDCVVCAFLAFMILTGFPSRERRDVPESRAQEGGLSEFHSQVALELPCPRTVGSSSSQRTTSCRKLQKQRRRRQLEMQEFDLVALMLFAPFIHIPS